MPNGERGRLKGSVQLATYRATSRLVARLPLGEKAAASLAGRGGAAERWVRWARQHRTPGPLLWVHAASVGEALTAEPVIRRVRAARPEIQVVLTYASPSLACWPDALPVARADYAPAEEAWATEAVVSTLAPALLAFSRTDLWPEMLVAAHARGVPVAVLGGTVRRGSLRLMWPATSLLNGLLQPIQFVGAVTAEDAARFERLGVPGAVVSVTGDPRHDQVLERPADLSRLRELEPWIGADGTIVAGSVEPTDEGPVLDAFAELRRARDDVRLLLVPHEPTPAAANRVLERAARAGVIARTWRRGRAPGDASCLVVDEVGGLADLYVMGTMAYVGGGFRRGGLHAVIEPAAYGVSPVFGPEHRLSDAELLLARGGAIGVARRGAAAALAAQWRLWLGDPDARGQAGSAARAALQQGAAGLTARRLLELLKRA